MSVKLRCASWEQVEAIYKRDLIRNALFLKSNNPPAIGTLVTVELMLPSSTVVSIKGAVAEHVPPGGANGRGPGVEVRFDYVPQSAMWIIETALARERGGDASTNTAASALVTSINEKTRPGLPRASDMADLVAEQQAPVANAESELVVSLADELVSLKRLNAFQVLGVSYDATDSDIRLAFAELTKRYHPDRFAKYTSAQLRMHAADIFILIRDAYQKLGNPTQRAQIAASLAKAGNRPAPGGLAVAAPARPLTPAAATGALTPQPGKSPPPGAARSAPLAVVNPIAPTAKPGATNAAKPSAGAPASAEASAKTVPTAATGAVGVAKTVPQPAAVRPTPSGNPQPSAARSPAVKAQTAPAHGDSWMTQVEGLLDAKQYDAAADAARARLKSTPADHVAKAYVELCQGYRSAAEGDRLDAAEHFEMALELDPSNDRAARELADMRRRATNERKGHLTRLMTKKD